MPAKAVDSDLFGNYDKYLELPHNEAWNFTQDDDWEWCSLGSSFPSERLPHLGSGLRHDQNDERSLVKTLGVSIDSEHEGLQRSAI